MSWKTMTAAISRANNSTGGQFAGQVGTVWELLLVVLI